MASPYSREQEAFLSFFQPGAELLEAALAYASLRIHVFPLQPGEKRPMPGSHGVQEATTRAEKIKAWWSHEPQANIGIGLRRSGIVILDIDPRNGGIDTLAVYVQNIGSLPPTYIVQTANGGEHHYYRVTADFYDSLAEELPKRLGPGLDLLVNGYAVAPPSVLNGGSDYMTAAGTLEEDFARLPVDWIQKVAVERSGDGHRTKVQLEGTDWIYNVGERNTGMTSMAGQMRRVGYAAEDIFYMLKVVGPRRIESFEEIDDREIWQIAKSVSRYPPAFNMTDLKIVYRGRKQAPDWPEPSAFHGPIGQWVEYIEPITEAHPAALLAQALVMFGALIGAKDRERSAPGFEVEGSYHRTGLYGMVIGDTAKAAKGDSWNRVWELMRAVDPQFKYLTGLQTGEGIIDYLADDEPQEEATVIKQGEKTEKRQHVKKGSRVDRRCMLYEPEFGRVLHVAERRGSVIKDILRDLWDSGETGKITAMSKQRVTEATVSLVGHITKPELERDFDSTDFMNGFGNRFLYVYATRTKRLPAGGARSLSRKELRMLSDPLKRAIDYARNFAPECYEFSERAEEFWEEIDAILWRDHPSTLINHLTQRGRPIVRRLAVIYAVADCSPFIRLAHLQAAWSLWQYCVQTTEYVFGEHIGDKVADKLYQALAEHPAGLSKQEIYKKVFKSNTSSENINRALATLRERGMVMARKGMNEAGTKTVDYYFIKQDMQF